MTFAETPAKFEIIRENDGGTGTEVSGIIKVEIVQDTRVTIDSRGDGDITVDDGSRMGTVRVTRATITTSLTSTSQSLTRMVYGRFSSTAIEAGAILDAISALSFIAALVYVTSYFGERDTSYTLYMASRPRIKIESMFYGTVIVNAEERGSMDRSPISFFNALF